MAVTISTASAMVGRTLAMIVFPAVSAAFIPLVVLRAKMPVVMPPLFLVVFVIIVPVIMDSLCRVFAKSVGDVAVVNGYPWSIVIMGGIPSVTPEEIVAAAEVIEVVGHSERNIETELGRSDKFRR
jgi:hypothetical protein